MAAGLWSRLKTLIAGGASPQAVMDLEQILLEADFGPTATVELVDRFEARRKRAEFRDEVELRATMIREIADVLASPDRAPELDLGDGPGPAVVVVLGVNGVGKTTTMAKLAARLAVGNARVLLAAADTYRAAATDQLEVWAQRLGVPCVTGQPGGDPAAVAYSAIESAERGGRDVVLVDTAGRLHTRDDLVAELRKLVRVVAKRCPGAPQETLLVVDATTGQNAIQQGKTFQAALPLTGVIVTKLDGTARGGAVVAIRRELGIPIRFVGMGESLADLAPFDPESFAQRLLSE